MKFLLKAILMGFAAPLLHAAETDQPANSAAAALPTNFATAQSASNAVPAAQSQTNADANATQPTNSASPAAATNAIARTDYDSFQIISKQNIFDPNRRPGYARASFTPRHVPQVDYFAYLGYGSYGGRTNAIFGGSNSSYEKTLSPGDSIAGYKVAKIEFDHVELGADGGKTVTLAIGSQMRREDNGPWSLRSESIPDTDSGGSKSADNSGSSTSSSSPATASSGGGGGLDDIIKRLMRNREQEK